MLGCIRDMWTFSGKPRTLCGLLLSSVGRVVDTAGPHLRRRTTSVAPLPASEDVIAAEALNHAEDDLWVTLPLADENEQLRWICSARGGQGAMPAARSLLDSATCAQAISKAQWPFAPTLS